MNTAIKVGTSTVMHILSLKEKLMLVQQMEPVILEIKKTDL